MFFVLVLFILKNKRDSYQQLFFFITTINIITRVAFCGGLSKIVCFVEYTTF